MEELISLIFASIDPKYAKMFMMGVLGATAALPLLEFVAERTSWKWDNQAAAFLKKALSLVPRLRFGKAPEPSRASAPTKPETPSAKAR